MQIHCIMFFSVPLCLCGPNIRGKIDMKLDFNPIDLFSMYMKLTGVPYLEEAPAVDPKLQGKKLGIVNGASWITLWSTYFANQVLPGVKLINVGNEGIQLNFMGAHKRGEPCPPQINIDLFANYAEDIVRLYGADAIIITCSTESISQRR